MIRQINATEIRSILQMRDLIGLMENVLCDFSGNKYKQPLRTVMELESPASFLGVMPALCDGLGVKLVAVCPQNAERGLPSHLAVIILMDQTTGELLALLDGEVITEMRTAAVSAVSSQLLAPKNARMLAILGSGVQAHSHYKALSVIHNFDEVRVWSPTAAHADRFVSEIGARSVPAEEAVRDADIVVCATSTQTPVLKGAWLKQGCHVISVGAPRPQWRELDDEAMSNLLFVDSREAALAESGDVILSKAEIYAELGEILSGDIDVQKEKTTVFKSLGLAVEDVSTAMYVYRQVTNK